MKTFKNYIFLYHDIQIYLNESNMIIFYIKLTQYNLFLNKLFQGMFNYYSRYHVKRIKSQISIMIFYEI